MKSTVRPKLQQLHKLLKYHEILGVDSYPDSASIRLFRENVQSVLTGQPEVVGEKAMSASRQVIATPQPETPVTSSLAELCEEVRACRSCALCQQRRLPVCGFGGERVKLLLVGGWLALSSPPESTKVVFGVAEDTMVTKMLQAIHLTEAEAFITNVIKCGIDTRVQPQKVHIDTCISYLERQISQLSPTVICTMGSVATRALLKVKQPLSQLRGRFHEYSLDGHKKIPLMPTYHPSFLLSNPEMKKPTWGDLQLIDRALQASHPK